MAGTTGFEPATSCV